MGAIIRAFKLDIPIVLTETHVVRQDPLIYEDMFGCVSNSNDKKQAAWTLNLTRSDMHGRRYDPAV